MDNDNAPRLEQPDTNRPNQSRIGDVGVYVEAPSHLGQAGCLWEWALRDGSGNRRNEEVTHIRDDVPRHVLRGAVRQPQQLLLYAAGVLLGVEQVSLEPAHRPHTPIVSVPQTTVLVKTLPSDESAVSDGGEDQGAEEAFMGQKKEESSRQF